MKTRPKARTKARRKARPDLARELRGETPVARRPLFNEAVAQMQIATVSQQRDDALQALNDAANAPGVAALVVSLLQQQREVIAQLRQDVEELQAIATIIRDKVGP